MFTKRRFIDFPLEKQHKKCYEILKKIYESLLSNHLDKALFDHYNEIQGWMNGQPLETFTHQQISNRYHHHLQQAKRQTLEHNLLPRIRQGDKESSTEIGTASIYLDHIRSAHNVGSIIRTVEAFALGEIYFSEQTPYITHKQVQDASMGCYEWVQCKQVNAIEDLPGPLIVMETSPEAISLYDFIFPEKFTLVVGNEEYGCSEEIIKKADVLIEIPLKGRKNSLNVANAFAIAASEIQRQNERL